MDDVIYLALGLFLFVVALGFVRACAALQE
jgi:hypothetical protein